MENVLSTPELKFFTYCQAVSILIVTSLLCIFNLIQQNNSDSIQLWCCASIALITTLSLCWQYQAQQSAFKYWLQQAVIYGVLTCVTLILILSLR